MEVRRTVIGQDGTRLKTGGSGVFRAGKDYIAPMRMIESIDSDDMVSSKDMWAEICPSSPDLQETNPPDNFSDSFLYPDPSEMPESNSLSYSPKPWAPLQDSEVYLAALERRLQKIKGQTCEVTSKDMLLSLGQAKKECWDRFLQESSEAEVYIGINDVDNSKLEHLKRWLQPEKVAISAEEVQCLIPSESPSIKGENKELDSVEQ
ncbi:coiled-coil domain-containing protein 32 isoform X1 [Ranitomeya variabilis]|uniref:coiled-coil domain-containing protein 32 isoform X1 n=2 Tax=Ranitomeya variabilis TaxID=490064 RepID=UPI0040563141